MSRRQSLGLAAVLTAPGEEVLLYILVTVKLPRASDSLRLSCMRNTDMRQALFKSSILLALIHLAPKFCKVSTMTLPTYGNESTKTQRCYIICPRSHS